MHLVYIVSSWSNDIRRVSLYSYQINWSNHRYFLTQSKHTIWCLAQQPRRYLSVRLWLYEGEDITRRRVPGIGCLLWVLCINQPCYYRTQLGFYYLPRYCKKDYTNLVATIFRLWHPHFTPTTTGCWCVTVIHNDRATACLGGPGNVWDRLVLNSDYL